MALVHNNLQNYYRTMFSLQHHHKYSIETVENMIPFERDLYVDMIIDYEKRLEEQRAQQAGLNS